MKTTALDVEAQAIVDIALEAGRAIMEIYGRAHAVAKKSDQSPVTEADVEAERIIVAGLQSRWPQVPIVAEELASRGETPKVGDEFFLVDPLDGTKEFISRNGEFTVNIAKIFQGHPVFGVVYAPALGQVFWGRVGDGHAAAVTIHAVLDAIHQHWTCCQVRSAIKGQVKAVASRSHRDAETEAFLHREKVTDIVSAGSSLKFCRLAEGAADLYPRFGRTMEWDTAAGQAVLEAAGGSVCTVDGQPLQYGKVESGFANPFFIARGRN